MKSVLTVFGIAVLISLLAWGWLHQEDELLAARQKFHLNTLLTDEGGYILNPPVQVASPFIRWIDWSPDGRYAVLLQTQLQMLENGKQELQHRVLLWNRRTNRFSVAWESGKMNRDVYPGVLRQVAFLKDAPACVVIIDERILNSSPAPALYSVYYASLGGRAVLLGQFRNVLVITPPKDNACYLMWMVDDSEALTTGYAYAPILAGGKLGETRPVLPQLSEPLRFYAQDSNLLWYEDGQSALVYYHVHTQYEEADVLITSSRPRHFLWKPRTNTANEITADHARAIMRGEQEYKPKTVPRPSVEYAVGTVRLENAVDNTGTVWLVEGEQAVLIAADASLAEVAPQGDGVLYVAHGAAFYRTLTRLSAEQSREAKDRLETVQYLRNAMQIATALRMYTEDYDDMLPPHSDDKFIAFILSPYVRDQKVFQVNGAFAFRYTMDGQNLADIQRPHEVVAGYLELPNGRVVIYADGHVKRQP